MNLTDSAPTLETFTRESQPFLNSTEPFGKVTDQWNRSFFLIDATDWGWGVAPFFSYYVELQLVPNTPVRTTETVVVSAIVAFSLLSNIAAAALIVLSASLRKTIDVLLLNLCLPTVLYEIHGALFLAARIRGDWFLGDIACRIILYVTAVDCIVSMWIQMLIGIARHQKIVPTADGSHRRQVKSKTAAVLCAGVWLLHLVCLSLLVYGARTYAVPIPGNSTNYTDTVTICVIGFPYTGEGFRISYIYSFYIFFIGFLLPFTITLFCNVRILRHVDAVKRALLQHDDTSLHTGGAQLPSSTPFHTGSNLNNGSKSTLAVDTRTLFASDNPAFENTDNVIVFACDIPAFERTLCSVAIYKCAKLAFVNESEVDLNYQQKCTQHQHITKSPSRTSTLLRQSKRQAKATITLMILLVVFAAGWIPVLVIVIWINFQHTNSHPIASSTHYFWTLLPSLVSGAINPFLYGFITENFQKAIWSQLRKLKGSCS